MNTNLTTSSNNSFKVQQAKEKRQRIVANQIKNGKMNNKLSVFYTNSSGVKRSKYDRIAALITQALQNGTIHKKENLIKRAGLNNTKMYNYYSSSPDTNFVKFNIPYSADNVTLTRVLENAEKELKRRLNAKM
jgi:hypothetical protein